MITIKKLKTILLGALLLAPGYATAATVCYPVDGCTGTSTVPSTGQLLVGQSDGTYGPVDASSIGLSGDANLWQYSAGSDTISPIIASTSDTAIVTGSSFVATSTTATSTFPILSVTNAVFDNATTTTLSLNDIEFTGEEIARAISTSIITLDGEGVFASTSATHFGISAGSGIIVDNWTDPNNPVIYKVSWAASSSIPVADLTADSYVVSIDKDGNVQEDQYYDYFGDGHTYDRINIGGYATNGSAIGAVGTEVTAAGNPGAVLYQFLHYFGGFNINGGNDFYNEFNDLSISKTAGKAFAYNGSYLSDRMNPNIISTDPKSNITFFTNYRDGAGGFSAATLGTTIDVSHYDDGDGTLGVVNNNQWQVKRIYFRPENENTFVTYGQVLYNSKEDAIASLATDIPDLDEFVGYNIHCDWLVVRGGATDLSSTDDAEFIYVSEHGTVGAGTQSPLSSLQDVYYHGDEPEILKNSTRNAVSIQNGSGGADNVSNLIEFLNTTGTTTAYVRADGLVSSNMSSSTYATTTSLKVNATTTTAGLSIGSLTGVLKATAGVVYTALVDLTSEVTGVLGVSHGGTGTSTSPALGEILVGQGDGTYAPQATSTLGFTNGTVTSVAATVPTGWAITGSPITTSGTLALAYDTGYGAVLTASTTEWAQAYASTTALTVPYIQGLFSNTATGLTYSGGVTSLTTGYGIPLTASSTNWNSFYNTPSTRITAGTNISWSGNTLNVDDAFLSNTGDTASGDYNFDSGTLFIDSTENKVGIGTVTPYDHLQIKFNSVSSDEGLWIENSNTNNETGARLYFRNRVGTAQNEAAIVADSPGIHDTRLLFQTEVDGSGLETRMIINGEGKVGIAVSSPAEKLETAGNIRASDATGYTNYKPTTELLSFSMASSSGMIVAGTQIPIAKNVGRARELTQYKCWVEAGTSAQVFLTDGTNDTEAITCGTSVTTDSDVATNDTFSANEKWYIEIGTVTGSVDYLTFEAVGYLE
jgi:hypothetical protein